MLQQFLFIAAYIDGSVRSSLGFARPAATTILELLFDPIMFFQIFTSFSEKLNRLVKAAQHCSLRLTVFPQVSALYREN